MANPKNRVSNEGCISKWNQRQPRKKRDDDDNDFDSTIQKLTGESSANRKVRGIVDVILNTPDDDGIVHRTSAKRRKQQAGPSQRRKAPDPHRNDPFPENLPADDALSGHPELELREFINELASSGEYEVSPWENRQKGLDTEWCEARSRIMTSVVNANAPPSEDDVHCYACDKRPPTLRCVDCNFSLLCHECDMIIHTVNPCHDRQSWQKGYFEFLPQEYLYTFTRYTRFNCIKCNCQEYTLVNNGAYIVVTIKGRFDLPRLVPACTNCNKWYPQLELQNILHAGLWPGHPDLSKTSYIFEQRLLQMWYHIMTNFPGASLHGFLGALGQISDLHGRKRTINHTSFSRAYREYSFMEVEKELVKGRNNMVCPSCSTDQLMCHIDGIHKLYRYKNASQAKGTSYHGGRFIALDSDVTAHLDSVYKAHPTKSALYKDIYCGDSKWKAARQSSSKTDTLEETGLVVAGCRHAIAQKAVNMFAGELYAYSHYLHVNFLLEHGIQYIWQDVVCKYWPWAQKVATSNPVWMDAVKQIKPALSVMHAKAHSWHCQVCWGGRYRDGAGAGSGEDMEQFFSYFSRIGNTTKHMTSARRIDTITDHVLYWNGRKIRALPEILCKRYQRMQKSIGETQAKLDEITGMDNKKLSIWKSEVIMAAKDAATCRPSTKQRHGSREQQLKRFFVVTYQLKEATMLNKFVVSGSDGISSLVGSEELFQLARKRTTKEKDLERERDTLKKSLEGSTASLLDMGRKERCKSVVSALQCDIELTVNSVHQKHLAYKGLADASKRRNKLGAQMEREKKKIGVMLDKLHQVQMVTNKSARKCCLDDVVKGNFPWRSQASASFSQKRKATDLLMFSKRLEEEAPYLIKEMKTFITYYREIQKSLEGEIDSLSKRPLQTEYKCVNDSEVDADKELEEPHRYIVLNKANPGHATNRGLIGLKQAGLAEVKSQIAWALSCFREVLSADGWRTVNFGDDEEEEESDTEEDNEQEEFVLDCEAY